MALKMCKEAYRSILTLPFLHAATCLPGSSSTLGQQRMELLQSAAHTAAKAKSNLVDDGAKSVSLFAAMRCGASNSSLNMCSTCCEKELTGMILLKSSVVTALQPYALSH